MTKNIKKLLLLLLTIVIVASLAIVSIPIAMASTDVEINSYNFTDNNFRAVITNYYDDNQDGFLSESERDITLMALSAMLEETIGEDATISTLKGIEYFPSLQRLRCGGIGIETLDVSQLPNLVELTCNGNEFSTLTVSSNTNLEWLNCASNSLTTLDVTANTKLTKLQFQANHLTSIDLTKNSALETLYCYENELTDLNVKKNYYLSDLNCSNNHLRELVLSSNPKLVNLTDNMIGKQEITAPTEYSEGLFYVEIDIVANGNVVASDLDDYNNNGSGVPFTGSVFYTGHFPVIENGFYYEYDTTASSSENMRVHVIPERTFKGVNFYADEEETDLITTVVVNPGEDATAPSYDPGQCKTLASWSGTFTNVTEDISVHAIIRDDHDYVITDFNPNTGIVVVTCLEGDADNRTYLFSDLVNSDSTKKNYVKEVDVNGDGVINVRDYKTLYLLFLE